MRTTIAIDDYLLEKAKQAAGERGQTLGTLVEDALRRELAFAAAPTAEPIVLPVSTKGTGLQPGININSNREVLAALDAANTDTKVA